MSQTRADTSPATSAARVRSAGAVCLATGILGAVRGIVLAVYPGQPKYEVNPGGCKNRQAMGTGRGLVSTAPWLRSCGAPRTVWPGTTT